MTINKTLYYDKDQTGHRGDKEYFKKELGWLHLDFLDIDIISSINKALSATSQIRSEMDTLEYWHHGEFNRSMENMAAQHPKQLKKSYTTYAQQITDDAKQLFEEKEFDRSSEYFIMAATIHAVLRNDSSFSECATYLAMIEYEKSNDSESAYKYLRPLESIAKQKMSKYNIMKGPGKNPKSSKKLKKRRAQVQEMKKKGTFKKGQKWPRTKWKYNKTPQQNTLTALNILYQSASACAAIDATERLENICQEAIAIIRNQAGDRKPYKNISSKFSNLAHQYL